MAPIVTVTLPSDGNTALAEDIDNPINAILAVLNGSLDDANIASMNGSKIVAGSLPQTAFAATANSGWNAISNALTYGANNGNKEFTVTAAADLTSVLSNGMRLKVTRGTVPPTQAASFASASSQYATHASPAGITFTGAFTCESWVFPLSYGTATGGWVINRSDAAGTSGGWDFRVQSDGTVMIEYATGSSFTNFSSSEMVQLNRWTHIAGVVSSTSSKTGQIYLNGVAVATHSPLSAATSLTQASVDLRIGAAAATPTNTYFNGYMSEVRVWSVAQTQSAIQSNMAINLVGTETNLVALYQFNGVWTDATSNANTLTASGGALNTQAANPYNAIELGIITSVSYVNPTTTIKIYSGNSNTIPNQTLTNPFYSTEKVPFGFNPDAANWEVKYSFGTGSTASASGSSWVNQGSIAISVPTGPWNLRGQLAIVATGTDGYWGLSQTNNAVSDADLAQRFYFNSSVARLVTLNIQKRISVSSQSFYYAIVQPSGSTGAGFRGYGDDSNAYTIVRAESSYI
jgi:hypothetical protein